eukprot:338972-Pleurochrysis_carterae.AAC.1
MPALNTSSSIPPIAVTWLRQSSCTPATVRYGSCHPCATCMPGTLAPASLFHNAPWAQPHR